MKIFANSKIWKKIVIVFVLLTSFNFIEPPKSQAVSEIIEPVVDLVVWVGDGVMDILNKYIADSVDGVDIEGSTIKLETNKVLRVFATIGVVLAIVVTAAVVIGLYASGVGAPLGAAISATAISVVGTIALASAGGAIYAGVAVYNADGWGDTVVLPLYKVSPEEIFKGEVKLFNVDFFNEIEPEYQEIPKYSYDNELNAGYFKSNEITLTTDDAYYGDDFETQFKNFIKDNLTLDYSDINYGDDVQDGGNNVKISSCTLKKDNFNCKVTVLKYEKINDDKSTTVIGYKIHSNYEQLKVTSGTEKIEIAGRSKLNEVVASWYKTLRYIAIVSMMIILVYIGIKILISSSANQKAKYKQLLWDWIVGMIMLFVMHYGMIIANTFVDQMTKVINSTNKSLAYYNAVELEAEHVKQLKEVIGEENIVKVESKEEANEIKDSYEEQTKIYSFTKDGHTYYYWPTNLMGTIRMNAAFNHSDSDTYLGWSILFLVMVCLTVLFVWTYLKRLVYMAFLTLIAPLVAMTYPLDKANDGKAQGFDFWFKEYIFNLLLQPVHLLLYTILVSSAIELATTNVLYSIVALGFMVPAEKLLRQMFNFSKASTPGVLGGPAGAALGMSAIRWLTGHGPKGDQDKKNAGNSSSGKGIRESKNISTGKNTYKIEGTAGGTTGGLIGGDTGGTTGGLIGGDTGGNTGGIIGGVAGGNTGGDNGNATGESIQEQNKNIFKKMGRGAHIVANAYGNKMRYNLKSGQPVRKLAKMGVGLMGGTALGMAGLALGVASGDPRQVLQNTTFAAGAGYKLGSSAAGSFANAMDVDVEPINSKKYRDKKAELAQKEAKHNEEYIRYLAEKYNMDRIEAQEKLENMVPFYYDNKITDIEAMMQMEKMTEVGKCSRQEAYTAYTMNKRYNIENRVLTKEKEQALLEKMKNDYNFTEREANTAYKLAKEFNSINAPK